MPQIKQGSDGSFGIQGKDLGEGPFVVASTEWNAASVDKVFFVANRAMKVKAIHSRVTVAGTDAGAVSAVIRRIANGVAVTAGVVQNTGSIDLKGAADTIQTLGLSAVIGALDVAAGDSFSIDFTGVLTSATGVVSVWMSPK